MYKTRILALLFSILCITANANEMYSLSPTSYVLSGNDAYDNPAYTISITINRESEDIKIDELNVSIYSDSLNISPEILSLVENPHLSEIRIVNDIGIFGSFFSIRIPFGKTRFFCNKKKYIYITSRSSRENNRIEAKISDPCE